jgi:hypothetical protein
MATTAPASTVVPRWHDDWNAVADAMFANDGVGTTKKATANGDFVHTDPYIYGVGGRLRWSSQDQSRMNDVLIATQLRHTVPAPMAAVTTNGVLLPPPDVTAYLNTTANTYRAVVEMAKKLNDFSTLTEQQRLEQLRKNAPDMSVLYNVAQDMDVQWPEDGVQQLSVVPVLFCDE